jgi:hypothetical protein
MGKFKMSEKQERRAEQKAREMERSKARKVKLELRDVWELEEN